MKVKIKDLKPNPYRDMKNYPINPEKIESLKNSIEQTGFWDNILARPKPGHSMIVDTFECNGSNTEEIIVGPEVGYENDVDCLDDDEIDVFDKYEAVYVHENADIPKFYEKPIIEIAYGHHRLQVLKELYKPEHEVDIPVKEIDDSTMIKIMANENDESWGTSPKIINETVRVTREFLFSTRGSKFIKTKKPKHNIDYQKSARAFQISEFLNGNWNEAKVYHALEQIELSETKETDKKHIDKEAVESFPTQRSAKDFVKAVKNAGNVTPKQQKRAAKKIIETKNFGETAVRRAVLEEKHKKEPEKKSKQKMLLYDLRNEIEETNSLLNKLSPKLLTLTRFKDEIGNEVYKNEIKALVININVLMQRLKTFLGGKNVERIKS